MANLSASFSSTSTATSSTTIPFNPSPLSPSFNVNQTQPIMGYLQNPNFLVHEPLNFNASPFPPMEQYNFQPQYSYVFPSQSHNTNQSFSYSGNYPFQMVQNGGFIVGNEEQLKGAYLSKVARNRRKLARQRTLLASTNKTNTCVSVGVSSPTSRSEAIEQPLFYKTEPRHLRRTHVPDRDSFTFFTQDKKLRVLLTKELKYSDVGALGRIVLPKREAEENLPVLYEKEGIHIVLKDLYSQMEWKMKYKYWSNNKSRMYVLENTGEFIRQNGLEAGDLMTVYEDEFRDLFVSVKRGETPISTKSPWKVYQRPNQIDKYNNITPKDEEEEEGASFASLTAKGEQKEEDDDRLFETFPTKFQGASASTSRVVNLMDEKITYTCKVNSTNNAIISHRGGGISTKPAHDQPSPRDIDQHNFYDDDCYGGLGILPELSRYGYLFFDHNT